MDVWQLITYALLIFIIVNTILFVWATWTLNGDTSTLAGHAHIMKLQYFYYGQVGMQILQIATAVVVAIYFKKK